MINIFVYEKGNYVMSYSTNAIPRDGDCLIYNDTSYQVLSVAHVISRDLEGGNNLCNIDLAVIQLD